MSSFIDKLTTLVNAQLNDLMGKNPRSPLARIPLDSDDAVDNPRHTARALRERLEAAPAYEKALQSKIDGLRQQALSLDEQADRHIQERDQAAARRTQELLLMKQRQLAIAESELHDHRRMSQHLLSQLLELEGALNTSQGKQQSAPGKSRIVIVDEEPDPRQKPQRPPAKDDLSQRINRLSKPE